MTTTMTPETVTISNGKYSLTVSTQMHDDMLDQGIDLGRVFKNYIFPVCPNEKEEEEPTQLTTQLTFKLHATEVGKFPVKFELIVDTMSENGSSGFSS